MSRVLFIILPVLLGIPQLSMRWVGVDQTQVTFRITRHDPLVMECQKSGSDVFYRYEYKLCRRRGAWFDSCGDTTVETRTLRGDAITETYTVVSDLWGDPEPASSASYATLEEAFDDLSTIRSINLKNSGVERADEGWDRYYMRVRAKFICKGQTNATLDRISSIVTLGLVSVGTSDSGWIDFNLADR